MANPPHVLHEQDFRKLIQDEISNSPSGGVIQLEADPQGRSFSGSIYVPETVTSGHLVARVVGPDLTTHDLTTYDVTLQAADMLDCTLAQTAFDDALPSGGLFTLYPSNSLTPNDGQISFHADNDWRETTGVTLHTIESTLNVGTLGEDVGSWIASEGVTPLDLPVGTWGVFENNIYYKGNQTWWLFDGGVQTASDVALNLVTGNGGTREQSIFMYPPWNSMNFGVRDQEAGHSVWMYLFNNEIPTLQVATNSGSIGNGTIAFCAGTVDPNAGDGLAAQGGTLYSRRLDDSNELWFMTDDDPITWVKIAPVTP